MHLKIVVYVNRYMLVPRNVMRQWRAMIIGDQITLHYQTLTWNVNNIVKNGIIRIYHEGEGRIEKSVPRIAVWHHEACRVMTIDDPEGQIFLSYPHTNNGFLFLLTTVLLFKNKLPEVPEYAKIQLHMMTSFKHNNDVTWRQCARVSIQPMYVALAWLSNQG